ncbi:MAG TPA: hypothetical protein VJM48_06925 [Methylibium sp.]|nr:hypothetical protein [Methylibium sp.]
MRHFHTLLRGLRAVGRVLLRRRPAAWSSTEPADLGTAFGLDAAIEANPGSVVPLAR